MEMKSPVAEKCLFRSVDVSAVSEAIRRNAGIEQQEIQNAGSLSIQLFEVSRNGTSPLWVLNGEDIV